MGRLEKYIQQGKPCMSQGFLRKMLLGHEQRSKSSATLVPVVARGMKRWPTEGIVSGMEWKVLTGFPQCLQ